MKKLTKTEVAKTLKVARTTVYNMIKRGLIVPDENGLIDPRQVDHKDCTLCSARDQEDNSRGYVAAPTKQLSLEERHITLLEKQISLLEHELARLQLENQALRTALGQSISESDKYVVTKFLEEVYAPYEVLSPYWDNQHDQTGSHGP